MNIEIKIDQCQNRRKNVKITLVSDSWYPCGVLEVLLICIGFIEKEGWPTPVLTGAKYDEFNQPAQGIWLESYPAPKNRGYRCSKIYENESLSKLTEAIRQADVVHIHSFSTLAIPAILIARKLKKKIILHLHTQVDEYLKAILGKCSVALIPFINLLVQLCCNKVDLVVTPSEYFAEMLTKRLKLKVKPSVWSAPIIIPENLPEVDLNLLYLEGDRIIPQDRSLLVYVGRIGEEKNIEDLLQLFKGITETGVKTGLVLIGDGEIKRFRQIANEILDKDSIYVSFLGRRPRQEILALNLLASENNKTKEEKVVGITDSLTETQGLGLLEQMACGLAVIAPKDTCMSYDIIQSRGGVVFSPDHPELEEISSLFADRETLTEMGERNSAYMAEHYSANQKQKELVALYEKARS